MALRLHCLEAMSHLHYRSRLRDLAVAERPQERLERLGPNYLSDSELLAMLLRSGTRGLDVVSLASQMINEAGSLAGCLRYTVRDFQRFKGIGRIKALQLITVMEMARRILAEEGAEKPLLDDPAKVSQFMRSRVAGLAVEKFWVLSLNTKNRLLRAAEVTSGTATSSLVHPREVFREAIQQGATAIICAHNHPSGDPSPSQADLKVTRCLREAAAVVQISLLDHVVIGNPTHDPQGLGYYSFAEAGMLS